MVTPSSPASVFAVFLKFGTHLERKSHEALQEGAIIIKRSLVFGLPTQHQFVLLLGGELVLSCDVLGGDQHRLGGVGIVAETIHHPVLVAASAAGTEWIRVIKVRAVGGAVAGDHQRHFRQARLDLLRGRQHGTHAGGAGLCDRWAGHAVGADHAHEPWQAIERMLLRHGKAEYRVVEDLRFNIALSELVLRHVGGKFDRMKAREAAFQRANGVDQ
jgi:hypothetical protein